MKIWGDSKLLVSGVDESLITILDANIAFGNFFFKN